jgi:PPM family protein phosphatase
MTGQNQDAIGAAFVSLLGSSEETVYLIVCMADGMGGLDDPTYASSLAVRVALSAAMADTGNMKARAARMVVQANNAIVAAASDGTLGTTLTCLICHKDSVFMGHIGDGRLLHVRGRTADWLSVDHTKLAEELGHKVPSLEAVKHSASSRQLSRSLGEKVFDESYVYGFPGSSLQLKPDDRLILCTDGVWTEITKSEMINAVNVACPQDAAESLVRIALERDPSDDASAIVISY